jgi:hypothetical protein
MRSQSAVLDPLHFLNLVESQSRGIEASLLGRRKEQSDFLRFAREDTRRYK